MNMGLVKTNSEGLEILFHQLSFLITGLCTTLGVQWLFYRGAASSISFLPQLSGYTGMLLVGCFIPIILKRQKESAFQYKMITSEQPIEEEIKPPLIKEEGPIPHYAIIRLASLDIMASFALTIGFSIIGSGMYQVIYSSVVIWCAILTWLFMGRSLSKLQWLAIIGTSIGLGISSMNTILGASTESEESATRLIFNGTLITLGGTFISACIYVYADTILSSNDNQQPLPARVCCWMGFYTSCFTWLWILFYTIPQWDNNIHIDLMTSKYEVFCFYLVITLANALHSWNYYELIERTGNVATGILQGLRAILVYALSHFWFCQEDATQCFTASKGCGSIIVISCVLLFTLSKK